MKSDIAKLTLSLAIDALDSELDSSITKINDTHQALKKQFQHLIDRQEALVHKHGGADIKLSDIIRLNERGTEMFARRDTLTVVKSSRLEALFSGRWENQLLRDDHGRVFMDVDPNSFKKILDYMYMVKISEDGDVPMSEVDESMKDMVDSYLDFFKLRREGKITPKAFLPNQTSVVSPTTDQEGMLAKMKQELDTIEKVLENEESFVAFFTKYYNDGDSATDKSLSSDISCSTTHKSDELCSKPESKNPASNGIITLYLNGDVVTYKVNTLCGDMTSKLAIDLSDQSWVREHTIVTEVGKVCILVEYPGAELKALVDCIHFKSITPGGTTEGAKNLRLSTVVSEYMLRLIKYLYNGDSEMVQLISGTIESTIITSIIEEEKIKEWLASVGKTEQPKLLYRASRDGWAAADFHRMCDDKGATITVVKNSDGYIFGGYTDVAWGTNHSFKSSSVSFLYSLKDHAGIGPVKMPMKITKRLFAVYHHPNNGPGFGFGSRSFDLSICTNANYSATSESNIGNTYELPANCANSFFLTGTRKFQVSEYEVFCIHEYAPTKKRKAT